MYEKIKKYQSHPYIKQLRDVRVLGLLVFGVMAVLVTWSTIQSIQQNYELQKQISTLQQQVDVTSLETKNQELSNQYYNTDIFLELAARRQFGMAAPGEKLIIVPKDVALAHTVAPPQASATPTKPQTSKPKYQQNLEAWGNFFFKHSVSEN